MRIIYTAMILFFAFSNLTAFNNHQSQDSMANIFPSLQNWVKKGKADIYTPDNLYEYINGAADVFISYDFQKLATQTYENLKQSITVDVYRHSDSRNGFGIYAQERPGSSEFIDIGTQGYYEKGILNFLKGQYYVKISCFDIKENEKSTLLELSSRLDKKLKGPAIFPATVNLFPAQNKVPYSENYIAKDFLGHHFLHSAFVTDYKIEGQKVKVFIIELKNKESAENMLNQYLKLVKSKGKKVTLDDGVYRFEDPYYKRSGAMNLMMKNHYLWGLFSADKKIADYYLKAIAGKII